MVRVDYYFISEQDVSKFFYVQHYPKDEAEMILNMPGPTDAQNLPTSVDLLLNDDTI